MPRLLRVHRHSQLLHIRRSMQRAGPVAVVPSREHTSSHPIRRTPAHQSNSQSREMSKSYCGPHQRSKLRTREAHFLPAASSTEHCTSTTMVSMCWKKDPNCKATTGAAAQRPLQITAIRSNGALTDACRSKHEHCLQAFHNTGARCPSSEVLQSNLECHSVQQIRQKNCC